MATATITSKGQMTIPSAVRRKLGIKTGEKVVVHALDDGAMIVRRKRALLHHIAGMLRKSAPRKRLSLKEIDEAIADAWDSRFERFAKRR